MNIYRRMNFSVIIKYYRIFLKRERKFTLYRHVLLPQICPSVCGELKIKMDCCNLSLFFLRSTCRSGKYKLRVKKIVEISVLPCLQLQIVSGDVMKVLIIQCLIVTIHINTLLIQHINERSVGMKIEMIPEHEIWLQRLPFQQTWR